MYELVRHPNGVGTIMNTTPKTTRDEAVSIKAASVTPECTSSRPTSLEQKAQFLSEQPWSQTGTSTVEEFDALVESLIAVLAMRLKEWVDYSSSRSTLDDELIDNLRLYVTRIGQMYRRVHYHAFQHAAHVTFSANKLLQMMTKTDSNDSMVKMMTPMFRFALVYATLIHDVDHQGVPNSTLVEEEDALALKFHGISVAEQQSIHVALSLLATPEFAVLHDCIMPNKDTRKAFRKAVIDMVLVTDISNPERVLFTQYQWDAAFGSSCEKSSPNSSPAAAVVDDDESVRRKRKFLETQRRHHRRDSSTRFGVRESLDLSGKMILEYGQDPQGDARFKLSVVLGVMINIADVAHTMQDFDTFLKWNKRLFRELHSAYHQGRLEWDPSDGWYTNQLKFFDAYVIPLATKAQDCGVFGSCGSTFLRHALQNKRTWQLQGINITKELIETTAKTLLAQTTRQEGTDL